MKLERYSTTLKEYLEDLGIDEIEDDAEFEARENEAIRDYCEEHTFNLSGEDMTELESRIDDQYFWDWQADYDTDISSPDPWYTEKWYDEDLIAAMREEEVPVTKENLDKFRAHCIHLFDDKSERNEILAHVLQNYFDI